MPYKHAWARQLGSTNLLLLEVLTTFNLEYSHAALVEIEINNNNNHNDNNGLISVHPSYGSSPDIKVNEEININPNYEFVKS